MYLAIVLVGLVVLLIGLAYLIQGPPYVPSDDESARQMLKMVKKYKPKRVLDMGSGDGKLVIMLAQAGFAADGVELNPWLVLRSRRAIKKAGVADKATIYWGSFWNYDVSSYDGIVIYIIKHAMPRLEKKLQAELRPGTHIVSNYFVFPTLKPIRQLSRARLYRM
jgi:ribosomal protein L11 methylase PrmA